jgi:ribosome-associated protein
MYDLFIMNHDDLETPKREPEPASKSQLKRDAEAAQALGKALVELPAARFAAITSKLELPENLREAIEACRAIQARGGRKRQLQYIGKLMRGIDVAPIRRTLEGLMRKDHAEAASLHWIERWRERLLAEGDVALAELLKEYPTAERQALRQLAIKARKERDQGRTPIAARTLFRMLRELLATNEEYGEKD